MRTICLAVFAMPLLVLAVESARAETPASQPAAASQPTTQPGCDPCGEKITDELVPGQRPDEDITSRGKPLVKDKWLEFGGDLRYRMYNESNIRLTTENPRTAHRFWHRPRARVWSEIKPVENVSFYSRLVYGPRYFCEPDLPKQFIFNEALFDQLYVKVKKPFDLPVTFKIGRQDIQLGDAWLIREGTPLDGGRTFFFDAARATFDFNESRTKLDVIYLQQYSDSAKVIRPFNDAHRPNVEQNEKGAIVYLANTSEDEKTRVEGYFIYKHADKVMSNGYDGDIYTFGGLVAGEVACNWRYKFEVAGQFGNKNGDTLCAMGSNNRIAYCFGDAWKTKIHFDYEYRSGAENANSNFDILWGRYTQFSNLYTYYISSLEGQMAMASNIHRFGPGIGITPVKGMFLGVNYDLMFRDRASNDFDSQGSFRGHLLTAQFRYNFTEDICFRVLYDLFVPGAFYGDRDNTANFLQTQISFRW